MIVNGFTIERLISGRRKKNYFFNMKILNFSLRVYDECFIKIEIFSHCFQCPVLFCKVVTQQPPPAYFFF